MAVLPIFTPAEIWKPCPDFEDIYAVSNWGRVKRIVPGAGRAKEGHVLATARNGKGYHYLNLCRGGSMRTIYVHTLVCRTFRGDKPTLLHQAAHRDNDKDNNREANLYWATGLQNHADRRRNGGILTGSQIGRAKLTEGQIPDIRSMIDAGNSDAKIGAAFGVAASTIWSIRVGRTWSQVAARAG